MRKYESKQQVITLAQSMGSKAGTYKGACKAILSHTKSVFSRKSRSSRWDWERWTESRRDRRWDGRARVLGYDPNDPMTPGRIMDRAYDDHRAWCRQAQIRLSRSGYGEIISYGDTTIPATLANHRANRPYFNGLDLIDEAATADQIPAAHDNISWYDYSRRRRAAEGDALHHEMYDVSPDGNTVLLCLRRAEGTLYGVKTLSKEYAILTRTPDDGITVTPAKKAVAAKAAKAAGNTLGEALEILRGNGKLPAPAMPGNGICYKKVAVDEHGRLVSVYDGSPWNLGQTRHDPARRDHNGGLYVYETLDQARNAPFPDESVFRDAAKDLVKCQVSGIYARYDKKLAFSTVTPLTVVEICE